jgi:tRNA A-37 threonylcarbamoyl transferase component Bud32
MVIAVRTERGPDRLEVVKEADTAQEHERLAHEAAMLRRAAHPGVVDVVSHSPGTLRLRHHGTPLARLGPLPADESAAIVRALAETVAAVHGQGVVHSRIDADHVVLGERDRPRLCGFGAAVEATEETEAVDVAALGRLLDELLDAAADLPWSPPHRGVRHGGLRKRALQGFRSAAAAAQRADAEQRPTARHLATALLEALPGMSLPAAPVGDVAADEQRRFADIPADFDPTSDLGWSDDDLSYLAIAEESDEEWITGQIPVVDVGEADDADVPRTGGAPAGPVVAWDLEGWETGDEPPVPDDDADDEPSGDIRPPGPPVITIRGPAGSSSAAAPDRRLLVGVAAIVLVLGAVAGSAIAQALRPFGGEPIAASTTTTTVVRGEEVTAPTYPASCEVPELPGPDVDGDDCPDPVELDDRVAQVGTVRVELGEEGDLVAVADSDCDGVATPVVLRPGTGEVFVFTEWSLDEPVEITATSVVPGAESIDVGEGECPPVLVTGDDVSRVVAAPR